MPPKNGNDTIEFRTAKLDELKVALKTFGELMNVNLDIQEVRAVRVVVPADRPEIRKILMAINANRRRS